MEVGYKKNARKSQKLVYEFAINYKIDNTPSPFVNNYHNPVYTYSISEAGITNAFL